MAAAVENDPIGIANIPNQLHQVFASTPFNFNIMCIGETGLGKSTFVNSVFGADIFTLMPYSESAPRITETRSIVTRSVDLVEDGVQLKLNVIDTPGFGNSVSNRDCWDPLVSVLEEGHRGFMNDESRVAQSKFEDARVHCCLYFIAPTGRGLKALDVAVLKKLHRLVNIIPVVGRADMLTANEQISAKAKILADLKEHEIETMEFMEDANDVDLDDKEEPTAPYCLSASLITDTADGKLSRVRRYPWGTLNASDPEHSDFAALRRLMLGTHLFDLIDRTNRVHYERYRKRQLSGLHGGDEVGAEESTPIAKFEALKRKEEANLKTIEQSLVTTLERTSKEQEEQLVELEQQLLEDHEGMQRELMQLKQALDADTQAFEKEKEARAAEATASPAPPLLGGKRSKRLFK